MPMPDYLQGLHPPSSHGENRSCKKGPGHLTDASTLFFLKADEFKETCLSFNVASLSLTWALKPCDRASD